MLNDSTRRLLAMPLIAAALIAIITASHYHLFFSPVASSIQTYIINLSNGMIASGTPNSTYMTADFSALEPGDIVLGGWEDCAYGHYSHAGIFIGDDTVMEALVDTGVTGMYVGHFMQYSHVAVLRVKCSIEAKQKAVDYVSARHGEMFFPLAFKSSQRYWNCTTILWKAYYEQGVDLDVINDVWISPENLKASPNVDIIYDKDR